jgi:molybdate transport system substrate-binding protein
VRRAASLLALLLTGCGAVAGPPAGGDPVAGAITVFAAASLTEAFAKIGSDFHALHPAATVRFNFAGTSTLVTDLDQGAQADVFASADQASMDAVTRAGLAGGSSAVFARNRLEIVVEPGNPKRISGLADLARPGLIVLLAAPTVPAGRYAAEALQAAGVTVTPASQETDVKSVVSKVALGEADAGIAYVTDVKAGGSSVAGVAIPDPDNVTATYPAAVVKGASNPVGARAFLDYLLGPGQRTLAGFGFSSP